MVIDYRNLTDLDQFHFHGSIFTGFSYNYESRKVHLTCANRFTNRIFTLTFCNTILIFSQSCDFWGGGNAILWINSVPMPQQLAHLLNERQQEPASFPNSLLNSGVSLISFEIIINSGDTLLISCESLEVVEERITFADD